MPIVGGLDIHRKQITFDYLDTETGQVRRGQIAPADRAHLRAWLARFAGREDVAFAVEGCAGWRYVTEELAAAGVAAHLAEPAGTSAARGRKRHAKLAHDILFCCLQSIPDGLGASRGRWQGTVAVLRPALTPAASLVRGLCQDTGGWCRQGNPRSARWAARPFMPAFSRATGRPWPATVVRRQPLGLLGRDLRGDPDQALAQILATVQLRD